MKISELFNEAVVVGGDYSSPLKDSDTVRVYHGTSDVDFLFVAITRGVTGGTRANRRYSYESNNNPRGLFVTPDLRTAKEFGAYVLEFHCRVSDLEAPVWPGGTFTVQGGLSGVFNSEDDREAERLRQRMRWSEDGLDFVRNSDRPELAALFITAGERQALFTGDLNRNSIRAIWSPPDPTRIGQTLKRMKLKEFFQAAQASGIGTTFGTTQRAPDPKSEIVRGLARKVVQPRDEVTLDSLIAALQSGPVKLGRDEIVSVFKKAPEYIKKYVWSDRQYKSVMNDLRYEK